MTNRTASCRIARYFPAVAVVASILACIMPKFAQANNVSIRVDGRVVLASLMSISDGHLQDIENSLKTLAGTEEARTLDWNKIKGPLARVEQRSVPAAMWFSLPDGAYWTVEQGHVSENLSDRPYFPRLLAGKDVIGDLVVSKSTGKAVAIVAVPVMKNGAVIGMLGSSVYLDKLGSLLEKEMALDKTMIFYSFNSEPLVGLDWDPQLIFLEPMKQNNESLKRAFREMLSRNDGTVSYEYRGRVRNVIYRKSPVTNWWYAFGLVEGDREVK
ncbi:MAG: hypothetical protein ABFD64_13975 [Armatimonadota bacterium]